MRQELKNNQRIVRCASGLLVQEGPHDNLSLLASERSVG